MRTREKCMCIVLFMVYYAVDINAQNIEIEITGIRSEEGQFIIEVYKDSQSFKNEKPYQKKIFEKHEITEGRMTVKMELKPGIYGLALIDDENNNLEMDYKIIGLAKEGFAFSDFFLNGLKKPDFSDFEFLVEENRKHRIEMKIRYM